MRGAYIDEKVANMSFEEWREYKREQERIRTHGAERINAYHELYDIYYALSRYCFNGFFSGSHYVPMYFIPEDLKDRDANGLYGYGVIMIDRDYYEAHGADESMINTLHHEMIHWMCDHNDVKDTEGEFHLEAFAEACKEYGGQCEYEDSVFGYSNSSVTAENMARIKRHLKKGR